MHDDELTEIVNNLRTLGSDVADIEAKRAEGGLPRSIRETFSAFANTRGGTLLLGLDESSGFAATGLKNPAKMQADLAALCSAEMEPPLRPEIGVHDFEGTKVLVAEVPELPRANKPCYFRGGGIVNGSYVRVADGDRKLTSYEVQLMLANRGQPRHDEEPVPGTGADDLDSDLVGALVSRLREGRPHAFSGLDDAAILRRMKVLVPRDGADVLSLAGLLALGRSPQEHFPQLMLTFVHYPTEKGAAPSTGLRYLDSIVAEGPIPVIVQDAMFALRRNMKRRAVVSGAGRQDIWEYPEVALREAVVNTLVHRDLSPDSRGTQVQVEMYPDRLTMRNPGGLFGPITVDDLGEEGASSARNGTLMRLLREVTIPDTGRPVCENIGSGIRAMVEALRAARMGPPRFVDKIATFSVTFPNHALLSDDVVDWIRELGEHDLADSQCVALAMLRDGEVLDNATYRRVTGLDSRDATAELQDLVARELVTQTGTHRWSRYQLAPDAATTGVERPRRSKRGDRRADLLAALGDGVLSRAELAARTGLSDATARRWLKVMRREGLVEIVGDASKSKYVRYRRTGKLILDEGSTP